jgi:cell division protein FtsN
VKNSRSRSRSDIGRRRLVFFSLVGLTILSLTFVLGMLVGRHWAREESSRVQTDKGKRSALTARGAPTPSARVAGEREADRTGQLQERLTFYQTLTAPLAAPPSEASKPAAKPPAQPKPTAKLPEAPKIIEGGGAPNPAKLSEDNRSATPNDAPAPGGSEARAAPPDGPASLGYAERPRWTVQVAAYRARNQAEELQRSLRAAGHDAYVTTVTLDDGKVHYRVRVGSFADRSQAERAAERLQSERSLVPFVTPK